MTSPSAQDEVNTLKSEIARCQRRIWEIQEKCEHKNVSEVDNSMEYTCMGWRECCDCGKILSTWYKFKPYCESIR